MDSWSRLLVLSAGGVLGVNARYWLGVWVSQRWAAAQFPWATFVINVTGSFAIGFLTIALTRWLPHPHVRLFVVTGFVGGYTTFSTFEYDSAALWERGEPYRMLANMVGSVGVGFAAVMFGIGLARAVVVSAQDADVRNERPAVVDTAARHPPRGDYASNDPEGETTPRIFQEARDSRETNDGSLP